ncbi:flagellar biosynthesis protein FlhB [bacterium]|nr:flagellar biosynthesis protein FlhB [bacterium]
MADESLQEKTEQASPRKRREAREKGNVPKSQEVNTAIVLIVSLVGLKMFSGRILSHLGGLTRNVFSQLATIEITQDVLPQMMGFGGKFFAYLLAPLVIMIMVAGVSANLIQSGWVFTAEPMKPKAEKLSIAKGIKRMFSGKSAVELVKGIFKMLIVGIIGYITLKDRLPLAPYLIAGTPGQIINFIASTGYTLAMRAAMALVILAAFDFAYQKHKHDKELRMTKQELKEEYKRTEGDPLIKSRIRSIQRERARQRMLAEVPEADVVITNPTHYAIAIKYLPEKSAAPIVVAKGVRLIAQKIKEIAKENDVPVVENKPLARALHAAVEVGSAIPYELYKAVAEILAYVYRLKKKKY